LPAIIPGITIVGPKSDRSGTIGIEQCKRDRGHQELAGPIVQILQRLPPDRISRRFILDHENGFTSKAADHGTSISLVTLALTWVRGR